MSSEKELILIILSIVVVFGYQLYKDKKKKIDIEWPNDER